MAVYFDHNATTPLAPEVLEAMLPYLQGPYANASSLHRLGRAARDAVEQARQQVADLVGAMPRDVIWTSGGTEANNLAIKGVLTPGRPARIAYGSTEHPAVMEAAESLRDQGVDVAVLPVDTDGALDMAALASTLTVPTQLVSLMRANNETGVIHDIPTVSAQVHAAGALLHVDAVQAAGKLPLDVSALGADLMSLSSHKLYGPKGVGALVRPAPVDLRTQLHGGAQEDGLRGGTLNVPAIVGFGAASALAQARLQTRTAHLLALRDRLQAALQTLPGVEVFAAAAPRLPNTVQFRLSGWEGEALLMRLDRLGFCVSSGSACASGSGEPSHVLLAMGIDPERAFGAVRVSLGEANTEAEVADFVAALRGIMGA